MASENMGDSQHAPRYPISARRLGALEHPLIIKDVDGGLKTFGPKPVLEAILDSQSPQISVPLYLRPDNPTVRPLTSHNALTHNVVLKVTVPKRTGRKRKRGSDDPFTGGDDPVVAGEGSVFSMHKLDAPKVLRRKLQDNVGRYAIEPIGIIRNTHRYRGKSRKSFNLSLTDFQYSLSDSQFMTRFVDRVLPQNVDRIRSFYLEPGIEAGSNIDLIPPPNFTPMTHPFAYNYSQNPYTKEVSPGAESPLNEEDEYNRVVNVTSRVATAGFFIAHDEYPVPAAPSREPDMSDPQIAMIMNEMRIAMEERPIWTRRSMWNRLGTKFASLPKSGSLVRHCLQYAGYQFKGGPWRDALVKYGLDPRSDPKYRIYQTLIFKLHKTRIGSVGRSWQAVRRNELGVTNFGQYWQGMGKQDFPLDTHEFNGQGFSTDGKVWQVCDITDPLLAKLFADAEIREECDVEISGWYHRVLWSVAKAIMKCKMLAIRFNRKLTDDDFTATLEAVKGPKNGGDGGGGTSIGISLPDLQLTPEECEQLRGKKMKPGLRQGRDRWEEKRKRTHYRVRIPLKESEAREAEKMIRLLSKSFNMPKLLPGATAEATGAPSQDVGERAVEREPGQEREQMPGAVAEGGAHGEDGEEEDGEGQAEFQEILDDLDEGNESDEESDEEDEDEDEGEEDEEVDDDEEDEEAEQYDEEEENNDPQGDPQGRANTKRVSFEEAPDDDGYEYYEQGEDDEEEDYGDEEGDFVEPAGYTDYEDEEGDYEDGEPEVDTDDEPEGQYPSSELSHSQG
ncbi:hypothetical protein OQA88_4666 [Cercophora sp. LCS_1]